MRRIQIITVVALILAALIFAYSQAPQTRSRTGQTETQTQSVQPVKAKKILVKELPKGLKGLVLKDGVFKLAPGYKIVRKTSNTIFVALNDNGPSSSFTCSCTSPDENKPWGACIPQNTLGPIVFAGCRSDPWDPCTDTCLFSAKIDGKSVGLAIY